MNINFDLLAAGCSTRCRHCYVNGGPGAAMPTETAFRCIEQLDAIAARLPGETSFTLDNEPMNHPEIVRILRRCAETKRIAYYHHGMTSGIPLMRRTDREDVLQAYLEAGYTELGITLHGSEPHHDEIVRRAGAYRAALDAAEFAKACGASVSVSLMFNRFFAEDAAVIDTALERLQPAFVWFAVPNFTPHRNMLQFEPYRGSLETLERVRDRLAAWGWRGDTQRREVCTAGQLSAEIEAGLSVEALFSAPQDELYCSVHANGELFVGNTGAETALIGHLPSLDPTEAAERIAALPGNRDYGAFYDPARLPDRETLHHALEALPQGLLYADLPSVLYRAMTALGVPTRIL